jgi:hypothetical protein
MPAFSFGSPGRLPATLFTELTDAPATLVAGKYVVVNEDGTALELVDAPSTTFPDFAGNTGKALVVNATEDGVVWGTVTASAPAIALVTDAAANRDLVNGDFDGNKVLRAGSASAMTLTVNSGLTGTEILTVIRIAAGTVTFVAGAGVTINSAGGALSLRAQYSSAMLLPDGTDNYILIGDIE